MNVSDERLEILIGKLLDGEISPVERRLLDEELGRNGQARALLERLQALDERSRAAVTARIAPRPGEPQSVFERAWQRHETGPWARVVEMRGVGRSRFAAGLAAGFFLGLILHLVLVRTGTGPNAPTGAPGDVPRRVAGATPGTNTGSLPLARDRLQPVMRNVEWYSFTDEAGNQWLVEGVREGLVRPVAYRSDVR